MRATRIICSPRSSYCRMYICYSSNGTTICRYTIFTHFAYRARSSQQPYREGRERTIMISQIFVLGGVLTTVLLPASDARSLADGKKSTAAVDKIWTAQDLPTNSRSRCRSAARFGRPLARRREEIDRGRGQDLDCSRHRSSSLVHGRGRFLPVGERAGVRSEKQNGSENDSKHKHNFVNIKHPILR